MSFRPQKQEPQSENLGAGWHWVNTPYGKKKVWRGHRNHHDDYDYYGPRRPRGIWPFTGQNQQQVQQQQQQQSYTSKLSAYGNAFNAQPQQAQEYEQDYYEQENYGEDYGGSFDEEYADQFQQQQQQTLPLQKQVASTPLSQKHDVFAKMTDAELALPANVEFHTVTYEASREITPSQLIGKDMKLKNEGKLVFSLANKHLEPIQATCRKDVYGVTNSKARNDLVKKVKISLTGNYNKKLLISLPTISAIGTELWRDGANHINFTVPAGALSDGKTFTVEYERPIPNGVIAFANVFDAPTPDQMEESIVHVKGRDYSLVPFTHSIIHYWNADHMNDGLAHTEETLDEKLGGDVRMLTSDVMKYLEIAKNGVNETVSLGNVTTDTMILLSACEGSESKLMTLRSNKDGTQTAKTQFMGLADANYYLGKNASGPAKERFMETPLRFDMTATFEYLKLDGTPIKLKK